MLVDNFPSFECDSVYVGNGGIFQFLNMLCMGNIEIILYIHVHNYN